MIHLCGATYHSHFRLKGDFLNFSITSQSSKKEEKGTLCTETSLESEKKKMYLNAVPKFSAQ